MSFETAIQQWHAGERRLRAARVDDPELARVLDRVVGALVSELRRRLGGPFTTAELVDLYEGGTDWSLSLAVSAAPEEPRAWDAGIVADAAFARYLHEARDYAGGRVVDRG
ncbi:MAG: hypothetical protein ACJ76T_05505 [Solirubrobacteraceae bacterium]